jgi:serpin B
MIRRTRGLGEVVASQGNLPARSPRGPTSPRSRATNEGSTLRRGNAVSAITASHVRSARSQWVWRGSAPALAYPASTQWARDRLGRRFSGETPLRGGHHSATGGLGCASPQQWLARVNPRRSLSAGADGAAEVCWRVGYEVREVVGRVLASICFLAAASVGCGPSDPKPVPAPVCSAPQRGGAGAQSLVFADTAFAVSFFGPAATAAGGMNVILSPYSVSAAMMMVDVGAAGQTQSQIEQVLQLPGHGADEAPAYASIACGMETDATNYGNELDIANTLWVQQGLSLEPTFESVLKSGYDAPPRQVDFQGTPASAVSTINAWVSSATQGNIPSLLGRADVDSTTRLVVVNAVYFKGTWADGFDPSQTAPGTFTLTDGTSIQVPTMNGTVNAGYSWSKDLTVVELPYKGGGVAMDFFMPTQASGLAQFESTLTPSVLSAALSGLSSESQLVLYLPKFTFTTSVELVPVLQGMGITDAFEPAVADFSGIDGAMDLSVHAVVQQALVEVDEQGTVAAAATAVSTCDNCGGGAESLTVHLDQPFLFLIRDVTNGSILFMGQVLDPTM